MMTCGHILRLCAPSLTLAILFLSNAGAEPIVKSPLAAGIWAEIRVIDAASGRGVPLAELETVNGLKFVTDNAGRVASMNPD